MKIHRRIAVILISAGIVSCGYESPDDPTAKPSASAQVHFGVGSASAAERVPQEKVYRKFMPGTQITLKARKTKYFLGENILLDYQISYDGDDALDVGTATGLGFPDCIVAATDQAGNRAPESTLEFCCTGQSGWYFPSRTVRYVYHSPCPLLPPRKTGNLSYPCGPRSVLVETRSSHRSISSLRVFNTLSIYRSWRNWPRRAWRKTGDHGACAYTDARSDSDFASFAKGRRQGRAEEDYCCIMRPCPRAAGLRSA